MIKFWIITITKRVGRDEAILVHEEKVYTDKAVAQRVWDEIEMDEDVKAVDIMECSGKSIQWK